MAIFTRATALVREDGAVVRVGLGRGSVGTLSTGDRLVHVAIVEIDAGTDDQELPYEVQSAALVALSEASPAPAPTPGFSIPMWKVRVNDDSGRWREQWLDEDNARAAVFEAVNRGWQVELTRPLREQKAGGAVMRRLTFASILARIDESIEDMNVGAPRALLALRNDLRNAVECEEADVDGPK